MGTIIAHRMVNQGRMNEKDVLSPKFISFFLLVGKHTGNGGFARYSS